MVWRPKRQSTGSQDLTHFSSRTALRDQVLHQRRRYILFLLLCSLRRSSDAKLGQSYVFSFFTSVCHVLTAIASLRWIVKHTNANWRKRLGSGGLLVTRPFSGPSTLRQWTHPPGILLQRKKMPTRAARPGQATSR